MVKNNITATLLTNYTLTEYIEALFLKIVIEKIKWPFCCSHKYDNLSLTRNRKTFGILHFKLCENIVNG